MMDTTPLDPFAFAVAELTARGALVDRDAEGAIAILPRTVAEQLAVPEMISLGAAASSGRIACGLGAPLLDRLIADVRATTPIAAVSWHAEPPKLAAAERMAGVVNVRNGVVDLLGSGYSS